MPNWRSTLAGVGFNPSGSFGAMRARVEDVEAIVIEDGMGRLSLTFTHAAQRSAMQYEISVPLDVTAQQVAQLLLNAFEHAHPEARGRSGSPHAAAPRSTTWFGLAVYSSTVSARSTVPATT